MVILLMEKQQLIDCVKSLAFWYVDSGKENQNGSTRQNWSNIINKQRVFTFTPHTHKIHNFLKSEM